MPSIAVDDEVSSTQVTGRWANHGRYHSSWYRWLSWHKRKKVLSSDGVESMHPREALRSRPPGLLISSAPWRAWAYAATGALLGGGTMAVVLTLVLVGATLAPLVIGFVPLTAAGLAGIPVGAIERRRLRLLGLPAHPSPHRTLRRPKPVAWTGTRLRENASWREFGYTMALITGLWLLDYVVAAVPLVCLACLAAPVVYLVSGPVDVLGSHLATLADALLVAGFAGLGLVAAAYLAVAVASMRVSIVRALLAPPPHEVPDMETVGSSGRLLDAFDAERRRIERDLHDGTQQRLVALGVMLDMARMNVEEPKLRSLLSRAHRETITTLEGLRELVRGIHPRVLTERGLAEAVSELARAHPMRIRVKINVPGRLGPSVESTAYFMVSEALANVAKHAEAGDCWVSGWIVRDVLILEVGDSGRGGLDSRADGGVQGMADRVAAVGGQVKFTSPGGGPTVLRAEIPCLPQTATT
ncbi:sensor histidine kinase [Nonomuraea diastatica]|uniref:histidine kinase n=2 Tax=Nonomuraea diastatica TaxID=1848329 RepID=A0A4R4WXV5_9ACTN|nr:sensor histidine kinase [Nonomuraea diastatica]